MPEITIQGWLHTVVGITAVLSGFLIFIKHRIISTDNALGKVYLLCTFIAAVTSLMIFQRGTFGIAHVLGVLTLLALVTGYVCEKTLILKGLSKYMQAISYTGTFLFHSLPAITDGLLRLPVGNPILTDIEAPILKQFYLAFLVTYIIWVSYQCYWLKKNS